MGENEDQAVILCQKYKILQKIGSGSFGSIYKCMDIITKQSFAAKIEKLGKGDGQLQYEIKLYQIFQGTPGIPKFIDSGNKSNRLFIIVQLLSHSLQDLFQMCGKKLSLPTTLQIGTQIITRLEAIHRKGFVHRDIKANNFMIGKKEKNKTVYILDFGLAKRYKDVKTGQHIAMNGGKSLVGTARYASIASHDGLQQCRRDDLQSLAYLLLYFLRGKLPWQGIQIASKAQKYAQIGKMKKQESFKKLCEDISAEAVVLATYYEQVRKLAFNEQPNYEGLKKIFKQELIKSKEEDLQFDWEIFLNKKEKESSSNQIKESSSNQIDQ